MKSKGLQLKDIILISLIIVFCIAVFYYYFGYRNFQAQIAKYKTDQLDSEIKIYQGQLSRMNDMQKFIDEHGNDIIGTIEPYNNLSNEIDELDRIFEGIDDMSVTWAYPTLLDKTVRRGVTIVFTTTGYDNVLRILNELNTNKYRSVIKSINVTADKKAVLDDESLIRTTVAMTFFEKVDDNTNLTGLVEIKPDGKKK